MKLSLVIVGLLSIGVSIVNSQQCDDIDQAACKLMEIQRPDLCTDQTISTLTCPRYCGQCPIECYHCNATVLDFHLCNDTTVCQKGEMCMLKELKSTVDGHNEYEMKCATKSVCDGEGLELSIIGRREIERRDISVKCCSGDRCNYPETQATTTSAPDCKKDVIFIVDESEHMKPYQSFVVNTMSNVTSHLKIGTEHSLVSLATFASKTTTRWDLNYYQNQRDLKHAIKHVVFQGGIISSGVNDALSYAVHHASPSAIGNRQNVSDVVVLMTGSHSRDPQELSSLADQLHHKSNDVITVYIAGHPKLGNVATDSDHALRTNGTTSDIAPLQQQLLTLICQ